MAIIEYRESLEENGIKNHEEIEKRVAMQRKKLEAECGLSDASAVPSRDRDSKGPDAGSIVATLEHQVCTLRTHTNSLRLHSFGKRIRPHNLANSRDSVRGRVCQ